LLISFDEGEKSDGEAGVLIRLRTDPRLKDLGDKVHRVRKAKNSGILIELNSDPTVKSSTYQEVLQTVAKEIPNVKVNVEALSQVTVVECRNMDEVTTKEEIIEALKGQFALTDF
jgi:hypothetical protein